MKKIQIKLMVVLSMLLVVNGFSYDGSRKKTAIHVDYDRNLAFYSNSLFIYDENDDPIAEINSDFELYIKGNRIITDKKDRKLLRAFYELTDEIFQKGNKIAHKGAMLGLDGVALAAKAVAGAVVFVVDGCDDDADKEFQSKIEAEAEEIEKKADLIERDADELERNVEKLEELNRELGQRIREWDSLNLNFSDEY